MKLKDLRKISNLVDEFYDFFTSNADGDRTGLYEEITSQNSEVAKIIKEAFYKAHLRNKRAQLKRNKNNPH